MEVGAVRAGLLLGGVVVAAALLVSGAAIAGISRSDSGLLQDRTLLRYAAEWSYSGTDAANIRSEAAGGDGVVNASDADAYLAALREQHLQASAPLLAWDGISPTWTALNVSGTGLTAPNGKVTITYDGWLSLTSSEGEQHTFAIQHPSAVTTFTVGITVPPPWLIVNTTGLSIAGQSNWTVIGDVTGPLATIEISELPPAPPPPPPPENDTTPPVVNAGQDMGAVLGVPVFLQGTAADDDPSFYNGSASYWWTFTYNATPLNFTGQNMSYTFWALGEYIITFSAQDASGNVGTDMLRLTVASPDQEPPLVYAGEDATVYAGEQVWFLGEAEDNDPTFPAGAQYLWSFTYNATPLAFTTPSFSMIFWVAGNYTLTFEATDAWGNAGYDALVVTVVLPDTTPPTLEVQSEATAEAGTPLVLSANATDDDPAFPINGRFWWTVTVAGQTENRSGLVLNYTFATLGTFTLTFTAQDGWGNRAQATTVVTVVPPDRQAPSVNATGNATATVGLPVRLSAVVADNDPRYPDGFEFWWTISKDGVELPVNLTGLEALYGFPEAGSYLVSFHARDPWGNEGGDSFFVNVEAAVVPPPGDGTTDTNTNDPPAQRAAPSAIDALLDEPLLLLGLVGVAGGAGAAGAVAYRRRQARAAAEAAAAAPAKPAHVVEAVLILNRDGRLIHFQASGAESSFDSPEVIGSMFTAVTEFIRDSFGKDGSLSRLTYGQNTIVIERSRHLFGAVIVYGEPDKVLSESLGDVLRRLELAYAGLVERWTGDREAFEGIEGFVAPLFAATAGLTRADVRAAAADKTVRLGSGTEHFKGYIRLRVAMVNQTEAPIYDARVTVLFNQTVLRLARVEPAGLKQEGLTVHLGDIAPGERLGASYYLDPQTCSQTNIEGVGTYRDTAGDSQTVKMKARVAEIVCPLFFTPEHANPAMMRRLIESSLDARDSRVYRASALPEGFAFPDLFNLAREAVQRHHVVLVRNIKQKGPFEGNAWFYGQTKHSRSPVIIRATVSEKRRAVEFFVAVDSPATLTGMLAEFQRSFTQSVSAAAPGIHLDQVMDDSLKLILSSEGLSEVFGGSDRQADGSAGPGAPKSAGG